MVRRGLVGDDTRGGRRRAHSAGPGHDRNHLDLGNRQRCSSDSYLPDGVVYEVCDAIPGVALAVAALDEGPLAITWNVRKTPAIGRSLASLHGKSAWMFRKFVLLSNGL